MFEEPEVPCELHPHWPKDSCSYCKPWVESGYKFMCVRETLTNREQDSFELLTGVRPHDRQDMHRIMVEKDLRFVDKGDKQDKLRRELSDWRRASKDPGRRGELPAKKLREKPYDFSKDRVDMRQIRRKIEEKP